MSKLSRKLLISVFTLAFAIVTLGATTFAWFTLTSTAEVDTIDMNVVAGEGIEVSIDGVVYKNRVTQSELLLAQPGIKRILDALTTSDGKTFSTIAEGVSPTNYLEFKLWVRSPNRHADVYLDSTTNTESQVKSWPSDTTFNYRTNSSKVLTEVKSGTNVDIYAANALRFSFESFTGTTANGFTAPKPNAITIFELDAVNSANTNLRLGTDLNDTQGLLTYWTAKRGADLDTTGVQLPTTVYHNEALGLKTAEDTGFESVTLGKPKAPIAVLDQQVGTDVSNNWYGFVMVRVWLEGWDPDNFDAILNKPMSIEFAFKVTEAVPAV